MLNLIHINFVDLKFKRHKNIHSSKFLTDKYHHSVSSAILEIKYCVTATTGLD